ncbi:hypothetical protein D9M71_525020 [compost metagenome]
MFELMKCRQNVRSTLGPTITTAAISTTCITARVSADQSMEAPIMLAMPLAAWNPKNRYQLPQWIKARGAYTLRVRFTILSFCAQVFARSMRISDDIMLSPTIKKRAMPQGSPLVMARSSMSVSVPDTL